MATFSTSNFSNITAFGDVTDANVTLSNSSNHLELWQRLAARNLSPEEQVALTAVREQHLVTNMDTFTLAEMRRLMYLRWCVAHGHIDDWTGSVAGGVPWRAWHAPALPVRYKVGKAH